MIQQSQYYMKKKKKKVIGLFFTNPVKRERTSCTILSELEECETWVRFKTLRFMANVTKRQKDDYALMMFKKSLKEKSNLRRGFTIKTHKCLWRTFQVTLWWRQLTALFCDFLQFPECQLGNIFPYMARAILKIQTSHGCIALCGCRNWSLCCVISEDLCKLEALKRTLHCEFGGRPPKHDCKYLTSLKNTSLMIFYIFLVNRSHKKPKTSD